jgi:glutathione synthase/RimK-type ligase-like ATP-grasp enzyme
MGDGNGLAHDTERRDLSFGRTPARIALLTYERAADLAPDDRPLVPALAALGVLAEPATWTDERVRWSSFDAVVIRSCWDYHRHIDEFRRWLDRLAELGVAVWNQPSLVRWNLDKRYLLDLARRGIATIPTIVVPRGAAADVGAIARAEGWRKFVLKPAISASAYETHVLPAPLDDEARRTVLRVTTAGDTLVQPFAEEVARYGEYSFVFIGGVFSHAAVKRVAGREFRVQREFGGSVGPFEAPLGLIDQAGHAMRALSDVPLYARVDGIARDGALLLMELELIEPNLFLAHAPGATERLAAAIARRL